MPLTTATTGEIVEDSGATCMARVTGEDATAVQQADITGITLKVFDEDSATPNTAVSTATLTVANVVYDTLQTDARWTEDSTGYNFRHEIAASVFATPDHRYRAEYRFDPVSGEDFYVLFGMYTQPVRSS